MHVTVLVKFPDYSDPTHYLSPVQHYFFRHEDLLHLRIEQFVRYFSIHKDENAEDILHMLQTAKDDLELSHCGTY